MSSIFSCVYWTSVGLLQRIVCSCLLILKLDYLFFLMLSCISFLYSLDINPLVDMSFAISFSHSVGCLLVGCCQILNSCLTFHHFKYILSLPSEIRREIIAMISDENSTTNHIEDALYTMSLSLSFDSLILMCLNVDLFSPLLCRGFLFW